MCPRCKRNHYNTVRIKRLGIYMPVNKCLVCNFLWIDDEDLIMLSKVEAKKMFVDTLMALGKDNDRKQRKNGG
jgi:hypothetical protein